jgi:hypothetical protein
MLKTKKYLHWHVACLFSKGRSKYMKKGLLILAAAALLLAPMGASAAIRGAVVFGYGPYWGPGWGPAPYYWGPYYAYPNTGAIKVDTKVKDAEIFIDGAYAGNTKNDKTLHLRPGTYNVQIREAGQTQYNQSVYVTAGKTLHIHPEL